MSNTQTRIAVPQLARADIYRLLSACFCQPEEAFLEEEVFGQLKAAMARVNPMRVPDVSALGDYFQDIGTAALLLDYSRLFLGPFEILARPYGSVYLDGEKIIMGDSTMQALTLYREGGFEVAGDFHEVPDHVAVELEFLYLLSFRIGQASDSDQRNELIELKRKFLSEHLGLWIGSFVQAIKASAKTDFYQQLADLTEHCVREDMQELAEAG